MDAGLLAAGALMGLRRVTVRTASLRVLVLACGVAVAGCSGTPSASANRASGAASVAAAASPSATKGPGGQILFTRFSADGVVGAYTVNADGTDERELAAGSNYAPRVAPDGMQVLMATEADDQRITTAIMRLDTGDYRELELPDSLNLACTSWSEPDGSRCAAEGWADDDPTAAGIYTRPTSDGGGIQRLTTAPEGFHDFPGPYSPDGSQIVFARTSLETNESTLHVIGVDGSAERQIADGLFGMSVTWMPDGNSVLADADGSIFVIPLDGSPPQTLSSSSPEFVRTAFGAVASPDGQWIAFSMMPPGQRVDVYVMRLDGSGLTQVTRSPANDDEVSDWAE